MKIINANTLSAKDTLIEIITNIDDSFDSNTINTWLAFNLGTDLFNAFIAFEDDEPIGMITAEVINAKGPAIYISYNYAKQGYSVYGKLLEQIEKWAKGLDIKRLIFYTKKNPSTFIKKFGFSLIRSVLEKDIQNGTVRR